MLCFCWGFICWALPTSSSHAQGTGRSRDPPSHPKALSFQAGSNHRQGTRPRWQPVPQEAVLLLVFVFPEARMFCAEVSVPSGAQGGSARSRDRGSPWMEVVMLETGWRDLQIA